MLSRPHCIGVLVLVALLAGAPRGVLGAPMAQAADETDIQAQGLPLPGDAPQHRPAAGPEAPAPSEPTASPPPPTSDAARSALQRILEAADGAPSVWESPSVSDTTAASPTAADPATSQEDDESSQDAAEQTGPDPLERLRRMARSPNPRTRVQAVRALRSASTPQSAALAASMLGDADPTVREEARGALAAATGETSAEALLALFPVAAPHLRAGIIDALPRLRGAVEPPVLKTLLDERADEERRCRAALLLAHMRSVSALEHLASLAKRLQGPLAQASAEALAILARPASTNDLATLASLHADPVVRWHALQGLARLGGPIVAETANVALATGREQDPQIRREMVALLGRFGNDDSVTLLVQLLQRDPRLQQDAIRALTELTGVNMGRSPRQWEYWHADIRRQRAQAAAERARGDGAATSPAPGVDPRPLEGAPAVPPGFDPNAAVQDSAEPNAPPEASREGEGPGGPSGGASSPAP